VTLFDQNSHQCGRQSQPGYDPLWAGAKRWTSRSTRSSRSCCPA